MPSDQTDRVGGNIQLPTADMSNFPRHAAAARWFGSAWASALLALGHVAEIDDDSVQRRLGQQIVGAASSQRQEPTHDETEFN
jgi:hypothetical protein